MNRILLVGCGHMGSALLNAWMNLKSHSLTVVDPLSYSYLKKKYYKQQGTTAKGIAPCYRDKFGRIGSRVGDDTNFYDFETDVLEKFDHLIKIVVHKVSYIIHRYVSILHVFQFPQ